MRAEERLRSASSIGRMPDLLHHIGSFLEGGGSRVGETVNLYGNLACMDKLSPHGLFHSRHDLER